MLLNSEWLNKEIKEEIKRYLKTNENEDTTIQKSIGCGKSNPKREIHSITGLCQKTKKSPNKQSNFTLKGTWTEEQTKPNVSERKDIIENKAEINEIKSKKRYQRSMNQRACSLKK